MINVTKLQLHSFLEWHGPEVDYDSFSDDCESWLDRATFDALKTCDLKPIVAGSELSEDHLGGDDMVQVAYDVLEAIKDGYAVVTWYGHDCEALVCGYRPEQLTIKEGPPKLACTCGWRDPKRLMGEKIAAALIKTGLPACPDCGQQMHIIYDD
jgi:hypothetical protein